MTIARRRQISLDHTPYYHCTSRCVRRAFLCGRDRYSGQDFEHRKQWLEERLILLSSVFAIDLLAYAVMSNHYHVVIRLDPEQAATWSEDEVIERWRTLYPKAPKEPQCTIVSIWRDRLACLSWYMRSINEPMARRANREDRCKGRFWEGRFKSQALLDEAALLKCMAYVDLNPVRAAIARTPESSDHTSIKARVEGNDRHLMGFYADRSGHDVCIPMNRQDYLLLVDWTGRAWRKGKRGSVPADTPSILARLGHAPEDWITEIRHYGKWYYRAVGSLQSLRRYCEHLGQQWLKGVGQAQLMQG